MGAAGGPRDLSGGSTKRVRDSVIPQSALEISVWTTRAVAGHEPQCDTPRLRLSNRLMLEPRAIKTQPLLNDRGQIQSLHAILFMCISEDAPISLAMSLRLGEVSGDFCQG